MFERVTFAWHCAGTGGQREEEKVVPYHGEDQACLAKVFRCHAKLRSSTTESHFQGKEGGGESHLAVGRLARGEANS